MCIIIHSYLYVYNVCVSAHTRKRIGGTRVRVDSSACVSSHGFATERRVTKGERNINERGEASDHLPVPLNLLVPDELGPGQSRGWEC